MKVKDRETGLILESNNEFTIQQWLKHPDKYVQPKVAVPTEKPEIIKKKNR